MPTVLRIGAFRFCFFSHEPNEPPHIHIDRGTRRSKSGSTRSRLRRAVAFGRTKLVAL
ncbi:MAG: DUF4160 domain-containing protein [Sphingomonas sp.]